MYAYFSLFFHSHSFLLFFAQSRDSFSFNSLIDSKDNTNEKYVSASFFFFNLLRLIRFKKVNFDCIIPAKKTCEIICSCSKSIRVASFLFFACFSPIHFELVRCIFIYYCCRDQRECDGRLINEKKKRSKM